MDICHITPFQLAKRWGLNPKTLQNWRSKGVGPPYLKIGSRVVYRQEDIECFEVKRRRNLNHC